MKSSFAITSLIALICIFFTACAPKSTSLASSATQTATTVPLSTPTLASESTVVSATSTSGPSAVAKPEMVAGATYRYVDGTLLVAVPGGPFTMGRQGGSNNPAHIITLSDFWIYSTKVTNRQYARCVDAAVCTPPNNISGSDFNNTLQLDAPVTGVNWDQANSYCTYVLGRLPTEAEWEKAARGPSNNMYPWGNDTPTCGLLNFKGCVGNATKVTAYPQGQSYYHALDMEGNAFEWVSDWYDDTYYRKSPPNDPTGPADGTMKVARSSGYRSGIDSVAAWARSPFMPDTVESDLGFRCIVNDPTIVAPFCQQISIYGPQPANNAQSVQKNVPTICPVLGITVAQQLCSSNSTYVTFTSNIPAQTTISGVTNCAQLSGTLDSYPQAYNCHADTTATISGSCTYTGLGNAYCPLHYTLDPNTGLCKWDGSTGLGNQCLTGTNFDNTNQCCSAPLGGKVTLPLCSVGSTLVDLGNSKYGCVTISNLQTVTSITKDILMPASCR